MKNAAAYISSTETAVKHLIDGINYYDLLLPPTLALTFETREKDKALRRAEFLIWADQNSDQLDAARNAQRAYHVQTFARATLCGSLLQIAAKAIECYSENTAVPCSVETLLMCERGGKTRTNEKAKKFCIGRIIYGIPIGLIIYAGRNQHVHFEEQELRDQVNQNVFDALSNHLADVNHKDPAFDLANPHIVSCAHNITALLGWRSYKKYAEDMNSMLTPSPC